MSTFGFLHFASLHSLTYQLIKYTKVEKKYTSRLLFLRFSLGMERTNHQKAWSFTKADCSIGTCSAIYVRKHIATPFWGRENGKHCSFSYTQIAHMKSPYLRPFSAIGQSKKGQKIMRQLEANVSRELETHLNASDYNSKYIQSGSECRRCV